MGDYDVQAELEAIKKLDLKANDLAYILERARKLFDHLESTPNYLTYLADAYIQTANVIINLLMRGNRYVENVVFSDAFFEKFPNMKPTNCSAETREIFYKTMSRSAFGHAQIGNKKKALNYLHCVSVEIDSFDDPETKAGFYIALSIHYDSYNTLEEKSNAVKYCRIALEICKKNNLHRRIPNALVNLIHFSNVIEAYDDAIRFGEEAIAYLETSDQKPHYTEDFQLMKAYLNVHNNLGDTWLSVGDLAKAEQFYKKGLSLNEQYGLYPRNRLFLLKGLGSVYLKAENYGAAIEHLRSVVDASKAENYKIVLKDSLKLLSEAYAGMGDYKQALLHANLYQERYQLAFSESVEINYEMLESKYRLTTAIAHNQQLEESHTLLRRAYNEQNELLKIVSHDLRNPLVALGLQAELAAIALQSNDMVKLEKYLTRQQKSVEFMTGIVEQLREMILIDNDAPRVSLQTISLIPIIKTVIERNEPQAHQKNIKIQFNAQRDVRLTTDETILGQVFENLLGNSIKYSHESSNVAININVRQERVVIAFVDNGVGMASDEIELLFGRFGRLPSSRPTNNESSLGLGLYIAHKQISQLKGSLYATSPGLGHGSIFNVELPL